MAKFKTRKGARCLGQDKIIELDYLRIVRINGKEGLRITNDGRKLLMREVMG